MTEQTKKDLEEMKESRMIYTDQYWGPNPERFPNLQNDLTWQQMDEICPELEASYEMFKPKDPSLTRREMKNWWKENQGWLGWANLYYSPEAVEIVQENLNNVD